MTRKELVSEILSDLKKYDDLGLIDRRTLNLTIQNELKRFGSNIMEPREKVVEIKGGKGKLPVGFYKLKEARFTDPIRIETEMEIDDQWRTDSYISRVVENQYEWDNHSNSHYKKAFTEVIEQRLVRGSSIKITHRLGNLVGLVKGISKDYLSNACLNKVTNNTVDLPCISINGENIIANFNEGTIFIKYESLQEVDGDLVIPDYPNLIKYLIAISKQKILENIWVNDETDNVGQKLGYFKAQAVEYYLSATTEVKFSNLSPNIAKKMRAANSRELRKYYK